MCNKLFTPNISALDDFCNHPLSSLNNSEEGILAVLDKNKPIFYAISPDKLAQLLAMTEINSATMGYISSSKPLQEKAENTLKKRAYFPGEKFVLFPDWRPDHDFEKQAALWGITLSSPATDEEITAFIAYWQAEGRAFHHVQWQQKLARSIQQSRGQQRLQQNAFSVEKKAPEWSVPDGFREG